MEPVLIGYFPKKVAIPDGYGAPNLKDICSVSTCIADGPTDGWIDLWLHNKHWVFSTRERVLAVLQGVNVSDFSVHVYRMLPLEFDGGVNRETQISPTQPSWELGQVDVEPLPADFCSLGFDVVEKPELCDGFGCSPLSCNGGWQKFETNEHCLVNDVSRAIELATTFSRGGWEPGPYRIVEVLAART